MCTLKRIRAQGAGAPSYSRTQGAELLSPAHVSDTADNCSPSPPCRHSTSSYVPEDPAISRTSSHKEGHRRRRTLAQQRCVLPCAVSVTSVTSWGHISLTPPYVIYKIEFIIKCDCNNLGRSVKSTFSFAASRGG